MHKPNPSFRFDDILALIKSGRSFSFVRFSDGEMEVLRNRLLVIKDGVTQFRGERFSNSFDGHDAKTYIPGEMDEIRRDLLATLVYSGSGYYKGIPSAHTLQESDQNYCLRMSGGMSHNITYADLLVNWNYARFKQELIPALNSDDRKIAVIGNINGSKGSQLRIDDYFAVSSDFFLNYQTQRDKILHEVSNLPSRSIILSSASSLSNVVGHYNICKDLGHSFIDVGTAINAYIGLSITGREYLAADGKPYKSHFGFSSYEW